MKKMMCFAMASLIALVLGCYKKIDVKPFNEQTKLLTAAFIENRLAIIRVSKEGQVSYTGIKFCQIPKKDKDGRIKKNKDGKIEYEDCSKAIEKQAALTASVFGALEQYTEALVALQAAPEKSAESAQAAADAINSIVSLVGYEPISSTITKFASEAWHQYAKYKAAKDLKDAIVKTQEFIPDIEKLIIQSIEKYESITSVFNDNILSNHINKNEGWVRYYNSLQSRRNTLTVLLATYNDIQEKQKALSELGILLGSGLIKQINKTALERNEIIALEIAQCDDLQLKDDCSDIDYQQIYQAWMNTEHGLSRIYENTLDLARMDVDLLANISETCLNNPTEGNCRLNSPFNNPDLLSVKHSSWMNEKRFIEEELISYSKAYNSYSAKLKSLHARQKATEEGLKAMKIAIEKWAKAHKDLSVSVQEDTAVSVIELAIAVRDIYLQFDSIEKGR